MKRSRISILLLVIFSLIGCAQTNEKLDENNTNHISGDSEEESIEEEENIDLSTTGEIELVMKDGQLRLAKDYFNKISVVDENSTIQNPENLLVMANKKYYLPADYSPTDLIQPNVPFVFQGVEQNQMRKTSGEALEKMFADAEKAGIQLIARSGYRSYQTQQIVFRRNVDQMGYDEAIKISAAPGTSEHQTGLTMDITANSVGQDLTEDFGTTVEGIWLRDNAHKYGFIMRYPEGKEDITQYSYEPWHFRYVGIDAAKVIFENNWTLEEFFDEVREI